MMLPDDVREIVERILEKTRGGEVRWSPVFWVDTGQGGPDELMLVFPQDSIVLSRDRLSGSFSVSFQDSLGVTVDEHRVIPQSSDHPLVADLFDAALASFSGRESVIQRLRRELGLTGRPA